MKWSKLRIRSKENLCDSLKERLDFHVARYRKSHDGDYRRGWISNDGEQLASWSCFEQLLSGNLISTDGLNRPNPNSWSGEEYNQLMAEIGVYSGTEFMNLLFEYLSLSPHDALKSKIPLLRALAIAERRIGKRTLSTFEICNEEDPLVLALYHLRLN